MGQTQRKSRSHLRVVEETAEQLNDRMRDLKFADKYVELPMEATRLSGAVSVEAALLSRCVASGTRANRDRAKQTIAALRAALDRLEPLL